MKIRNEADYLVHLVRCAIREEQPQELPVGMSFETVLQFGLWHQVANLAFLSVKKLNRKPDEALFSKWQALFFRAVQLDMKQAAVRENILAKFREKGVRSLEAQGTKVKKLYADPSLRTMSDLDFIVDEENLGKAGDALEELGFDVTREHDQCCGFLGKDIMTEVHFDYLPDDNELYLAITDPFGDASPDDEEGLCWSPSDTSFYLFNILHTLKHYRFRGCGIRRILDLYLLKQVYDAKVDHERMAAVFERYRLTSDAEDLFALAEVWFGSGKMTSHLKEVATVVYRSAVHGTDEMFLQQKFRIEREQGKKAVGFQYFMRRLFPTKETLYRCYPVCEKHRLPVFLAWFVHLGNALFNPAKRARGKDWVRMILHTKKMK